MKLPTIGEAMAVAGKPARPTRPSRTGRPGYRKGHPTLTSPSIRAALPVRSIKGVQTGNVAAYVKALRGGQ